ncbi:MAG: hypothetical protein H6667_15280 [Ardenticatenaceae bacterium]|nr:hypothetical protein [Ardenticatenaceae bacterium]
MRNLLILLAIILISACIKEKENNFAPVLSTIKAEVATPFLVPTSIPTSTIPPAIASSPTLTEVMQNPLTTRHPTLEELQAYLITTSVDVFYPSDPIGDQSDVIAWYFEQVNFEQANLSETTDIFYQDVNGDGEVDLILSDLHPSWWGQGIMAIFLWVRDHYIKPFVVMGYAKYFPYQRVSFEDWTGDNIPEVIFDFKGDFGGTGYFKDTWMRYVIHCQESCSVVWNEIVAQTRRFNAIGLTSTIIVRTSNDDNKPEIRITTESFNAPEIGPGFEDDPFADLRVYTSTLQVYTWNGDIFEQSDEQVLSLPETIVSKAVLNSTDGPNVATLNADLTLTTDLNSEDFYRPSYDCALYVNGMILGEPFNCYRDFSTVEWVDLTGDGQKEVVVIAQVFDTQRLLAYQWDAGVAMQIADISGDIIRSDLYGVRLEDVDGDGQLEIMAGVLDYQTDRSTCKTYGEPFFVSGTEVVCYHELAFDDLLYSWDGNQFTLDEDNN